MSTVINRAESCERDRQAERCPIANSPTSPAAREKPRPSPFVFVKHYDKASPVLA